MQTYPDVLLATTGVLRDALATFNETAAVVTRNYPPDSPSRPSLPFCAVSIDSAGDPFSVLHEAIVRVVVHSDDGFEAMRVALLAKAVLVAYAGGPLVYAFHANSGPVNSNDPDVYGGERGEPLASFTVIARMRAQTL